jgi:spoIIIJ-associated protein
VAHAEASARTVTAAVTAAAAQLGLRSDQVDVEVLEDPVPSTFGYIGTPARVRVTPRTISIDASLTNGPYEPQSTTDATVTDAAVTSTDVLAAGAPATTTEPAAAGPPESDAGPGPTVAGPPPPPATADVPPTTAPPSTLGVPDAPDGPEAVATPAAAEPGSAGGPQASDQPPIVSDGPRLATATPRGTDNDTAPSPSELSSATKPSRRTYRDEPIEPEMVEVDTERAGDFLEGLLDALDVDGDITTWIDGVGGHIDLEGPDLNMLVGSNGETLDALQELTRLAVLRQSKRRVRLLLDINGFRARQRQQLISIVQTTVEQVIKTREEHEFQPMTPAERKVVHDAVAAIDGVHTESLGEEPNRRVVIRPT